MSTKSHNKDYVGMQFGNRIVLKNECEDEDWIKIGKKFPTNKGEYVLSKCLNCGNIMPTHIGNLYHAPKKCVFCSGLGNHNNIDLKRNTWVIKGDTAICNVQYKNDVISFYIDADDYDRIKNFTWRISKKRNKYYVVTGSKHKDNMAYLHTVVLGMVMCFFEIDHIDGNSLNNRKNNLRVVTHSENCDNIRATRIDNKIGIRGISLDSKSKKYVVDFRYRENRYYFKQWDTIEEAVYCRKLMEDRYGLNMLKYNPLAEQYMLKDSDKKKEIENYVLSKIS